MTGPLKNTRHEKFAQEYLTDFDLVAAACRAGVALLTEGRGYYVYVLSDRRTGEIFYVGKGKGRRLSHHRRAAGRSDGNQVKAERIRSCGDHLGEFILFDDLDEPEAFKIEKVLIGAFRGFGLTNIASGIIHPIEAEIARIDASIAQIRPYDDWMRTAPVERIAWATKYKGSARGFYDWFLSRLLNLRMNAQMRLAQIKGHSA